jgi:hypothetical protein
MGNHNVPNKPQNAADQGKKRYGEDTPKEKHTVFFTLIAARKMSYRKAVPFISPSSIP